MAICAAPFDVCFFVATIPGDSLETPAEGSLTLVRSSLAGIDVRWAPRGARDGAPRALLDDEGAPPDPPAGLLPGSTQTRPRGSGSSRGRGSEPANPVSSVPESSVQESRPRPPRARQG